MEPDSLTNRSDQTDISSPSFKERIVNKDTSAFKVLFSVLYDDLFAYGIKFCGSPALVKDSIQEVFLNLWRRNKAVGSIHSLRSYLLVSLRRVLLTEVKKKRKEESVYGEAVKSKVSYSFSASEITIKKENRKDRKFQLAEALNELSPRLREAIYLKYFHGLSYEEMEMVLDINYQSIRNNMHRAVKKLRVLLDDSLSELMFILIMSCSLLLS
jgi:RNA polymerase sigma factor (sigma-70 family)